MIQTVQEITDRKGKKRKKDEVRWDKVISHNGKPYLRASGVPVFYHNRRCESRYRGNSQKGCFGSSKFIKSDLYQNQPEGFEERKQRFLKCMTEDV